MSRMFKSSGGQNEGQWISISDMMAGLMVIFLFIAISFILRQEQENKEADERNRTSAKIEKILDDAAIEYSNLKQELLDTLHEEFYNERKQNILTIDDATLAITLHDREDATLFEQGSDELPKWFKDFLNDFIPRYIGILMREKFKEEIEEIRIEGHTSSEWGEELPDQAYILNMDLSQNRTRKALRHILTKIPHNIIKDNKEWLQKKLTANGLSSSKPLDKYGKPTTPGNEHKEMSRRVEFNVRIDAEADLEELTKVVMQVKEMREPGGGQADE